MENNPENIKIEAEEKEEEKIEEVAGKEVVEEKISEEDIAKQEAEIKAQDEEELTKEREKIKEIQGGEENEESNNEVRENLERQIEETKEIVKALENKIKILESGKLEIDEKMKTYAEQASEAFQRVEDKGIKIAYKFRLSEAFENLKNAGENAEKGIEELTKAKEKLGEDIEMMKKVLGEN